MSRRAMSLNAVSRIFDEALTFGQAQRMEEPKLLHKCPNHTGNLNMMRLQDKWCDVTIRVNGMDIRAHKVVLAANLKYFETMLSSESFQESKKEVIPMESVQGSDLEKLICYAYTGKILLTNSNALNMLELANYLGEEGIEIACIRFLERHLKVEDALRAYTFANSIGCLTLKNVAKSKILLNFDSCLQSSDYLDFKYECLMDVLADGKKQPIESQQKLFDGIIRWIMHDANKRKIHISDLLNSISLSRLTTEYLISYLANQAYSNDECGVIKDILFCYKTSTIEEKKLEPILMAVGEVDWKFSFQLYNFTKKKWSPLQGVPNTGENNYSNSVILNNQLYYVSGSFGRCVLQQFDPVTEKNTILNSSKILRGSTLCACSKFIYLCGGAGEKESMSDQVLRYDPQANTFELLAPMPEKRWHFAAVVYQDSLHILGGLDDSSRLDKVIKHDAGSKKWVSLPSMRESRHSFEVAVLGEKLYACGGDGMNSVEVYDPEKNSWEFVASMNKSRFHFLTIAREGKLLAIGGHNENSAEVYDPDKDQWEMDQELYSELQIPHPKGDLVSGNCATWDE